MRLRVGIARDEAFGFYYADDLEALAEAGAELVPIDTLHAERLPAIDALVIGGGFPETQMRALEANEGLRRELTRAIEAGLPVYAECGGLMYLARSISWQGETARMVGALPGDAVLHPRPVGRGYARLESTPEASWLPAGSGEIAAHEFHYASLENLAPGLRYAYRVARGHGVDGVRDGIVHRNVLASFCHLRGAGARGWAAPFRRVRAPAGRMSRKLSITARAAQQVRRAAAASGAEAMALRVAAKREDDGSVLLGIGFDAERANDELIETAGVTLLVSHHSRDLLEDMVLDFVEPDFVVVPAPPEQDGA